MGELIRRTRTKSALIFVHGFNTSFDDAVLRNAQIIYDLDCRGLSILYSWSSHGSTLDYRYDLDGAYRGRDGFIFLLKELRDEYGIQRVDVLAHSMGNLDEEQVAVMPGSSFGFGAGDFIRISLTVSDEKIEEACRRMAARGGLRKAKRA